MFRGATLVNLDAKSRFAIPTRYRGAIHDFCQGQMVCTIDIHQPCLLLYTLPEWETIEQKLASLSTLNPAERRIQRLLLGHASECQLDTMGRLLLPTTLRQHANLVKEIMLVGQYNKFELWSKQQWQQQVIADIDAEQASEYPLSERLQDLSL
jgi:MraZ protein